MSIVQHIKDHGKLGIKRRAACLARMTANKNQPLRSIIVSGGDYPLVWSQNVYDDAEIHPLTSFTISIATPAVVTKANHGFSANDAITVTTTGALPTGLGGSNRYYVLATGLTADDFQFSLTAGGAAINTSGTQSGTHYLNTHRFYPPAWARRARCTALVQFPQDVISDASYVAMTFVDEVGNHTVGFGQDSSPPVVAGINSLYLKINTAWFPIVESWYQLTLDHDDSLIQNLAASTGSAHVWALMEFEE